MNEDVVFGIGGMGFVLVILALLTIIIVAAITQGTKIVKAKTMSASQIARDEAYRKLAEEAVSAQQKIANDQQRIIKDLAEMKQCIYAMEKMLREVE